LPPSEEEDGSNFLTLREQLVPFLRLREVFADSSLAPISEKAVIVAIGERRVGLAVDQLLGSHQTVVKSLGRLYREVRCVSGATILGDGRIALILDVFNLIAQRERQEEAERLIKATDHVD